MTQPAVRVSPHWLRLREAADARARSSDLAAALRAAPPGGRVRVVHDLGCGDGSMGRWLSPRLDGPQHWVLHDLDPELLRGTGAGSGPRARGAPSVSVETRLGDVTRLGPDELEDASLVTASALLDLLTGEELARLVAACASTGAPTLLALSVTGAVRISPADPADTAMRDAFNDHQRRPTRRGGLLGPDAGRVAAGLFHEHGYRVRVRPSPWVLHADPDLATEWLVGWVGAAVEQRPTLAATSGPYLARRLREVGTGSLRVVVHHLDLLATPGGAR